MAQFPRDMSAPELLAAAKRMNRRLTKHLDALDSGDADALDDLVVAVRTTLCFGRGDRLLLRLCNVFRIDYPEVSVPETLVPADAPYRIGPLPALPSDEGAGKLLSIPDWVMTQAVTLPGVGRRTWDQVLADFGNTYGAHVSATVPAFLDEIRAYGVANGTMGGHMIRAAGRVAEHGLAAALAAIEGDEPPLPRDHHVDGVHIGLMGLTAKQEAYFNVSCTAHERVELFSMPVFENRRMTGIWNWDAVSSTGSVTLDWSELNE